MNKTIKTGMLFLAGSLMTAGLPGRAMAAVYRDDTAASYISRISSEASGLMDDWISEGGEEDALNGPGAGQASLDGDSPLSGPKIHEVSMGEKYHSEFELYENSIDGKYFIYSNVSNGGITDQPVYVEIPADVLCRAEKDGAPMNYTSGQTLSAKGTYVMYLTALYDKNVPLSRQEEYRTVFRFRIDEKRQDGSGAEAAGALVRQIDGLTGSDTAGLLNQAASELGISGEDLAAALGHIPLSPDGDKTAPEEGGREEEKAEEETAEAEQTEPQSLDKEGDSPEEGREKGSVPEDPDGSEVGRSQVYLTDERMYLVTLENGFTFRSSVPEGMIINQAVAIYPEEGAYTLYRGEEETALNEKQELAEYGSYRLVSGEYEFTFEINNTYVNRNFFTPPAGTRIHSATYNGEPMDLEEGSFLTMEADGRYLISLEGNWGEILEVELNRDTIPPEVDVSLRGQTANITYHSQDLASVTLSKNGGAPREFNGTDLTETGSYVLTVTDRAGNETVKEFTLRYRVNVYGIMAIGAAVTAAAAAVVVLVRKKRKLTVR